MFISRKLTAHAIAPAPFGVTRDRLDHARLIIPTVVGPPAAATVVDRAVSITARDSLIAAYLLWTTREATRTFPHSQASKDRAMEEAARYVHALVDFVASHDVPLDELTTTAEELPNGASTSAELAEEAGLDAATVERHPLYESIGVPPARSGKLDRYLGQLDSASRRNLERHLKNPDVSSSTICDSLRGNGFIVGRTTIKEYRRQMADRSRSKAGDGANGSTMPGAGENRQGC